MTIKTIVLGAFWFRIRTFFSPPVYLNYWTFLSVSVLIGVRLGFGFVCFGEGSQSFCYSLFVVLCEIVNLFPSMPPIPFLFCERCWYIFNIIISSFRRWQHDEVDSPVNILLHWNSSPAITHEVAFVALPLHLWIQLASWPITNHWTWNMLSLATIAGYQVSLKHSRLGQISASDMSHPTDDRSHICWCCILLFSQTWFWVPLQPYCADASSCSQNKRKREGLRFLTSIK